jgi:DNA primase
VVLDDGFLKSEKSYDLFAGFLIFWIVDTKDDVTEFGPRDGETKNQSTIVAAEMV